MEIYIEYALIENFLYDGLLLWISYYAAKVKTSWWKLTLSAFFGSVFAVIFPLLRLPLWAGGVCKLASGCLLCLIPFPRRRKGYALVCILFFAFSFGFGGALLGIYGVLSFGEKIPSWLVFIGFSTLSLLGVLLVHFLYAKRRIYSVCYDCKLWVEESCVKAVGLYDSGNLAMYQGVPICFVSPILLYELIGEKILKDRGQVCDETVVSTINGKKKVRLYKGKIEMKRHLRQVYFASSKNMIGREYAVLIHARILEGQAEKNEID